MTPTSTTDRGPVICVSDGRESTAEQITIPIRAALRVTGVTAALFIYFLFEFPQYLAGNVKYAAMLVLSIALMGTLTMLCFESHSVRTIAAAYSAREALGRRIVILVLIALASLTHLNRALLDHHIYFQARIVPLPLTPATLAVWGAFTAVCATLLVKLPRTNTPILALALIWGIVIRGMALSFVPFNPKDADMLVAVNGACEAVLRGINPYTQTFTVDQSQSFPLIYFPLLWIPYLPLKAIGLDIRWLSVLAQIGMFAVYWGILGRRSRTDTASAFVLVFLILLPDMVFSVFYRQLSLYWLLGATYLWLVWRERWNLALFAVAGLAATRVTAFTVLWLHLLYIWKRRGIRTAIAHGIVAAAGFVLLLTPFLGAGLERFRYVFFDRFIEKTSEIGWERALYALSVGGVLERIGLQSLLVPLQATGVLVIGVLYILSRDRSYTMFARLTVLTYAYFLWVSGFIYIYYWVFPLVLLCTLYCIQRRERGADTDKDHD